jgi:hypothetical protein
MESRQGPVLGAVLGWRDPGGPTLPGGRVLRVDNAHRMNKDGTRLSVPGAAASEWGGGVPGSRAGWDPPWIVRPKKRR